MIDFPARCAVLLAGVALAAALPVQAAAASGRATEGLFEERTLAASAPAPGQTAGSAAGAAKVIEVGRLAAPDPEAAGTLSKEEGGFGSDMWEGTARTVVESLLPRIPVHARSLAMNDLIRRLLLSAAVPPAGGAGKGADLLALRLRLLLARGDVEGAQALLAQVPAEARSAPIRRIEAEIRFLGNDNARACALAAAEIARHPEAYWQRALTFCQALAGEREKAALGVDLLHEMGERDAVFDALIEALSGSKVSIDSMQQPTPLLLAMVRAARLRLPADAVSTDRLDVLASIAVSPNADIATRLIAAERAQAEAALPAGIVRELYAAVPVPEKADRKANSSSGGKSKAKVKGGAEAAPGADESAEERAAAYRRIVAMGGANEQARALGEVLAVARQQGRYQPSVAIYMDVLGALLPTPQLLAFATEAVRALLVVGAAESAGEWVELVGAEAETNSLARAAQAELVPLVLLSGIAGEQEADLAGWWERVHAHENARTLGTVAYTLLDAVGEDVPPELWAALPAASAASAKTIITADPALKGQLKAAAAAGRIGETVLLSLVSLGDRGTAGSDVETVALVVGSLRAAGLGEEARALAVEAAAAAGI